MPRSVVRTDRLMVPIAHFSFGTRAGDWVYIGATAGTDAKRRLAGASPGLADAGAQSAQMFANLELSLELLGASARDLVRVKTYLTDWRDLSAYEAEYERHLAPHRPSHSIVGTRGFPLPQASVETEFLAVLQRGAGSPRCFVASPVDVKGKVADSDPAAQTALALQNLAKSLEAAGLSLKDVVMLSVALSDIRHFVAFEAEFRRHFGVPYPARSVQGCSLERPGMLVEVEAFAVAGGGRPVMGLGQPGFLGAASPGMLAGDALYIGAQLGVRGDGSFPPDVESQVRLAWERINALLRDAGMAPESVIHTANTLTDWRCYAAFNSGFAGFVSAPFPPRATVLGDIVDPRALVQIETLAHKEGGDATVIEVKPHG